METQRWLRLRELFEAASRLELGARRLFLDDACSGDPDLRREVESLLRDHEADGDPLGEAVDAAAREVVRDGVAGSLEPGRRIGKYRIVKELEQGGMGAVFVAEDTELRRYVALKVLTGWMEPGGERLRRFRREARALAALQHPNIVTIYSVEHEDDVHFLTTELVDGERLDEVVPDGGLDLERFFAIAIPLAEALSAAHAEGVIHRDLKPANIMRSREGSVKVLDFGLAKLNRQRPTPGPTGAASATLTRSGVVMGTIPYMSPEQVEAKPLGPSSDIFSLGIILYEMITGSRPFQGDSSGALISAILKEEPRPIRELDPRLPPRLGDIIRRCLEKDPNGRYQDAARIARDLAALQEALGHHPRIAAGLTALSALLPRVQRSRLALAAAGAVLIALVALALNFDAPRRRVAEPPAQRSIASLAVLPFTVEGRATSEEEERLLADGITEMLTTELSKIGGLKVISRESAMRTKGTDRSRQEIAAELGVDAVVEGSVRRAEDRLRVTAQLVHAASGEHLWADSLVRHPRGLLVLQGELARAIAERVEVTLTPAELARLGRGETIDPRASAAYLRGLGHWNRFAFSASVEAFQDAIDIDPDFARAHAGLASARQMQGVTGQHPPKLAYSLAKEAAARALELDEELAAGHVVAGWTALHFDWDWEAAEREFRRAIELDPNDSNAHTGLSHYLASMGRFDEAVAAAERALELDPLAPMKVLMLTSAHYLARDYERASFELFERFDPASGLLFWMSARLAHAKGDFVGAAQASLSSARMGLPEWMLDGLEEAFASEGAPGYWRAVLKLRLSDPQELRAARQIAEFYSLLGETDEAFRWLERAYERRDSLVDLGVDPIWDPLRADPRFGELLTRLQLPQAPAG